MRLAQATSVLGGALALALAATPAAAHWDRWGPPAYVYAPPPPPPVYYRAPRPRVIYGPPVVYGPPPVCSMARRRCSTRRRRRRSTSRGSASASDSAEAPGHRPARPRPAAMNCRALRAAGLAP